MSATAPRLGRICDIELEICECEARLTAIIVPGPLQIFRVAAQR